MTTEINVYYFEHNCIFIRMSLFQNFVSPPSISMHCWILRVMLSIKLCISLWLILSHMTPYILISFSIFLRYFWLISSTIHPQTFSIESKSRLKLGHSNMVTFSPLIRCLWGLQHVFGLFNKFMPCNVVICFSLHTAGPPLLIISCFNLLTILSSLY